jgi:hypothetical protein
MMLSDEGVPVPATAEPNLETPMGEEKPKRKVPNRGVRKRVLGEGEGDYCIAEIIGQNAKLPAGSLVPIPKVPRFTDTMSAIKWIRQESGDLLTGKQVMIYRACEILSLTVQTKPQVVISTKPKVTVSSPTAKETSDG